MNRYIMSLVLCCVLPFGACAWLNAHAVDAPGAFPGVEDVSSETSTVADSDVQTTDPAEELPSLKQMAETMQRVVLSLRVDILTYEIALAIVEERSPNTGLNPDAVNEAFAAMFERPLDPTSPPWASWYKQFSESVRDMSNGEVTLHQTTAEDPVFSRHPSAKKAWRAAHVFIRVERVMKDGKKRSSGIILSAPEPKEKRTSFPVDKEEDGPVGPDSNPLGQ